MTATMRAVVLDAPGPPEAFEIRDLPIPEPVPGWVLIAVKAFGVNHAEQFQRLGMSGDDATFPRVFGIEAAGIVAAAPGGEFEVGQQVVALMGGMGRTYDGGYAEYTCVPAHVVIPFSSELDWPTLGAIPEMLQASYGSLSVGLDVQPGQTLLIRGGTSAVGMTATVLAKDRGMTVLSTTRRPERFDALREVGVDHPILDDGEVAAKVREIVPDGVDVALEMIGVETMPDTMHALRRHGVACFTGMLSTHWSVADWYPMDFIPHGVRMTAYAGEADDLPAAVLQKFVDDAAAGRVTVPLFRTYPMDEIAAAHRDMEAGAATGKLVVVP
jgi:NADPH2:quinone reductase